MGTAEEHGWRATAETEEWRGTDTVPDALYASKRSTPGPLTTDLWLRFDPAYEKISRRVLENSDQFTSSRVRPVISDTRKPVSIASKNTASSRRLHQKC